MSECSDPVFAGEMVGPGVLLDPPPGPTTVVAPVDGRVVKLHPHAFVVLSAAGLGVLVHLGIDTVRLEGAGFEVVATEGATVAAGDPMVRWDPATILPADSGMTTEVPVVLLDRPKGTVTSDLLGQHVAAGVPLFDA